MKITLFATALLFSIFTTTWETDFNKAKEEARQQHKYVLLNFSGSDWCGPCIRMHKEIFENASFQEFAGTNLVLVNADFPRLKKNQLSKQQQAQNDELAGQYNKAGNFPCTVLLDAEGKLLHTWNGYPPVSPEKFITQLKEYTDARN